MTGTSFGEFRIPTRSGLTPGLGLTVNGVSGFDSSTLRRRQSEFQQFGILSLQKQTGTVDLQASVFTRYNSLRYSPDPLGDCCSTATPRVPGGRLPPAACRPTRAGR